MTNTTTLIRAEIASKIAEEFKDISISGRWITLDDLEKVFTKFKNSTKISFKKIGVSEENRNIHQITTGTGSKRILIWTQMHGNESTGTKAVIDLLNYIYTSKDDICSKILENCTIKIIPILNPDGAEHYTRVNAHAIDLNRDAVDINAKDSQLLRTVL